jgi:hypothetical protein
MTITIEQTRKDAVEKLLNDMEMTAASMRTIIIGMPPEDLIGYIYAQRLMKSMAASEDPSVGDNSSSSNDTINETQFLLEYVHAVLASDTEPDEVKFDEAQCVELIALSSKLKEQAMFFAMASSVTTESEDFGSNTADIEFQIKSTWVLLRGNRYQVLEGEFYSYVLAPHDDILKEVYGVGALAISEGFQDMANATRMGHANAAEEMFKQFDAAQNFAMERGRPLEDVMEEWIAENVDQSENVRRAIDDMFRGGTANVSRHTKLPSSLLQDLAYRRGEETEFFIKGDFAGTPYRTLPARKKPLIQLGSDYFAVDPCFTRDAGYRALLFNLLQRKPEYKKSFEERQKIMSEGAFPAILSNQLPGAIVYQEVYYKDPVTNQWSENDTLVLIEDVLYLVEAKAGAAATIASPALDFRRHIQSVKDLVLKAHKQCERFFNYLGSADEVPLYTRTGGKYQECGRIRNSDYRVKLPIGLTVESFSPISTFCKELPQVEPLLGKHPFISISIDDLLVLKRVLPTPGIFAHYMEVRQTVAGMKGAFLFDELDHLGAYIAKNRFDEDIADQFKNGEVDMAVWDGMSQVIDKTYEGINWVNNAIPMQEFPDELLMLLQALDKTRSRGWLFAESYIRDYGGQARQDLAQKLFELVKTIEQYPERYFAFVRESRLLFVWMQSSTCVANWDKINNKAKAVGLCTDFPNVIGIFIEIGKDHAYKNAELIKVEVPSVRTVDNAHIFDDANRMGLRTEEANNPKSTDQLPTRTAMKIGRNEPCYCGSGMKYKKCHGR